MSAIITNKFRIHAAELLKVRFDELSTDKNYYLGIGKPLPWTPEDYAIHNLDLGEPEASQPTIDHLPPYPCDTVYTESDVWKNLLALKRIGSVDVSFGLRRYDWESGTVYAAYSSTDCELYNHPTEEEIIDVAGAYPLGPFYVVTSLWRVYKCIDNNKSALYPYGSPSTSEPTGTSTDIQTYPDGYKWKFMYQIDNAEVLKFVTSDWVPVKTLDADDGSFQWAVQQAANPGAIEAIRVETRGSSYVDIADGQIDPGATTNTCVLKLTGLSTYGQNSETFNNSYQGSTIAITSGATTYYYKVASYDAGLLEVTIEGTFTVIPSDGDAFSIRPTVEISGDGSGAFAVSDVDTGTFELKEVILTNTGSNYTIATATVSGGNIRTSGQNATVEAEVGPRDGHGSNAVEELGGHYLILNVKMAYNEGDSGSVAGPDFPLVNEYRHISLLRDVKDYLAPNDISTDTTLRATKYLQLSSTLDGPFLPDEIVESSGGAKAKVLQFNETEETLLFIQDLETGFDSFGAAETLTGITSGATATIDSIGDPEVLPFSGELIYLEQRRPVVRAIDQVEDIKLILEF